MGVLIPAIFFFSRARVLHFAALSEPDGVIAAPCPETPGRERSQTLTRESIECERV